MNILMQSKRLPFPPTEFLMKLLAFIGIVVILLIFIFVFLKSVPVFRHSGMALVTETGFDRQISEAFYAPAAAPVYRFGMLGLIVGTLLSTLLALIAASMLGIGAAVAICEFAPRPVAAFLLAVTRLLASIPSVVFGLIGVILVAPWVESSFVTVEMQMAYLDFFQMTGRNLLTAVIVLAFMIAPMVISLTADALYAVPLAYKETGYAFGMNHFRVILKIILPEARPGIVAGLILGAGRGIGEAIAVSMVCGGIGALPQFSHGTAAFLTPVLPLAAAIVNKSEAMSVPSVSSALFACGAILLLLGTILSLTARVFLRRFARNGG
jgi:phosphate transport system permease protein